MDKPGLHKANPKVVYLFVVASDDGTDIDVYESADMCVRAALDLLDDTFEKMFVIGAVPGEDAEYAVRNWDGKAPIQLGMIDRENDTVWSLEPKEVR